MARFERDAEGRKLFVPGMLIDRNSYVVTSPQQESRLNRGIETLVFLLIVCPILVAGWTSTLYLAAITAGVLVLISWVYLRWLTRSLEKRTTPRALADTGGVSILNALSPTNKVAILCTWLLILLFSAIRAFFPALLR